MILNQKKIFNFFLLNKLRSAELCFIFICRFFVVLLVCVLKDEHFRDSIVKSDDVKKVWFNGRGSIQRVALLVKNTLFRQ